MQKYLYHSSSLQFKQKCSTSSHLFFHSRFQAVNLHLSHIPFKFTAKPDLSSDSEQIPREHQKVKPIYEHYAEKSGKEASFATPSLNPWRVGSGTGRKGQTIQTLYFLQLSFPTALKFTVVTFCKCSSVCSGVSADRHNKCYRKPRNSVEDLETQVSDQKVSNRPTGVFCSHTSIL